MSKYVIVIKRFACVILCMQAFLCFLSCGDDEDNSSSSVSKGNGILNGHEYVDLGLPSGTKWATMNVGADEISDYGWYFAYGEVSPKNVYNEDTYFLTLKYPELDLDPEDVIHLFKEKKLMNDKYVLFSQYDAATANWGEGWRMPTATEFDELCSYCKVKYDEEEGSVTFIGKNGNSVYFPAAGHCIGKGGAFDTEEVGCYWSSSPLVGWMPSIEYCTTSNCRWNIDRSKGFTVLAYGGGSPWYGYSVRAVCKR